MANWDLNGTKPWVTEAGKEVGGRFAVSTIYGVGSRSGASDHPNGLALDFMVYGNRLKGDAVAAYVIANGGRLGVTYVIWYQRIWSMDRPGWRGMEDRGSDTANHFDHVHVSFTTDGNPREGSKNVGPSAVGGSGSGSVVPAGNNSLVPDEIEALGSAIRWITDGHNLMRIGLVILGGALVIFALFSWAGLEAVANAGKKTTKLATGKA